MENVIIVSRHKAAIEFIAHEIVRGLNRGHAVRGEHEAASMDAVSEEKITFLLGYNHPTTGFVLMAQDGTEEAILHTIPVLASANADDVRGKVVFGNLPLHLAQLAEAVVAVEFGGAPPRGQEYTLADMKAASARLCGYRVVSDDRFAS